MLGSRGLSIRQLRVAYMAIVGIYTGRARILRGYHKVCREKKLTVVRVYEPEKVSPTLARASIFHEMMSRTSVVGPRLP
jgi:hypothetical protein